LNALDQGWILENNVATQINNDRFDPMSYPTTSFEEYE